jgi:shikimate dehydrogenase/3-dehydroquinate dehydratase type I
MKLIVTVFNPEEVTTLPADHDGVEIRAENLPPLDVVATRALTDKPLILTHRGKRVEDAVLQRALDAGFDYVDVEYRDGLELSVDPSRVILSYHDYDGMPDVAALLASMKKTGAAHLKVAVTPRNFADNQRLLQSIAPGVTVIGMGERGLYSRILAPFLGSEMAFVAASQLAAPGQLTLQRALDIYGSDRANIRSEAVFAIAGNPAGHSLSPSIHNRRFREKGVRGAYTIASFESFEELIGPFVSRQLRGLSVTAPFKDKAFAFAQKAQAEIGRNAKDAGAVNTLVNAGETIIADNTDVDGFDMLLRRVCGRDRKSVALIGSGGTARAALVAATRQGMHVTVYNRTETKAADLAMRFPARAAGLDQLRSFDGEIIINTVPSHIDVPLRPGMAYLEAAYGEVKVNYPGVDYIDGIELLNAQAVRQHELFMKAFE